jgi:hypothetical protein
MMDARVRTEWASSTYHKVKLAVGQPHRQLHFKRVSVRSAKDETRDRSD